MLEAPDQWSRVQVTRCRQSRFFCIRCADEVPRLNKNRKCDANEIATNIASGHLYPSFRSLTLFESDNYYSVRHYYSTRTLRVWRRFRTSDPIRCRYTMLACLFQRQRPPTPVIRELKSKSGRRSLMGTSPTSRSYTAACTQALTLMHPHI